MTLIRPEDGRPADVDTPWDTPRLAVGAVIVYFDPEPSSEDSFRRVVATGPEIIDPRTNDWWAPVMRRDRTVDLLPSTLIVRVAAGLPASPPGA
jgi:hypothetical protein